MSTVLETVVETENDLKKSLIVATSYPKQEVGNKKFLQIPRTRSPLQNNTIPTVIETENEKKTRKQVLHENYLENNIKKQLNQYDPQ